MNTPLVVLVHGIASVSATMWPLASRIRKAGFETKCYGYASLFRDLQFHGNQFQAFLNDLSKQDVQRDIHIVAHSLGGILTRQALHQQRPNQLRRVVTLGSPHLGTPTARFLTRRGLGFIKTLANVSDDPHSLVNQLGPVCGVELGTITASYDWVIPTDRTQIAGESDHVCIFSGHNGLLVRPKAAQLTIEFLKTGSFGQ